MKQRYLVLHDYGMGGLWWWIHARSVREVQETFAEVEVIDDPAEIAGAADRQLEEVDIDAATMPPGLDGLRADRDAQRGQPGFGARAGQQILYLHQEPDDDDPLTYLSEIGPDGRRIRQVEVDPDGGAVKTDEEDWPFNSPMVDFFAPRLPGREIERAEFERAWATARWETDR